MATHSPLFRIGLVIPNDVNNPLLGDKLHVEFIESGFLITTGDPARDAARAQAPDKRKNHAVIRIPLLQQTKYEGRNVRGIFLSMELAQGSIESNRAVYQMDDGKGVLLLKHINYNDATYNTMQSYSVKLQSGLRIGHLIKTVLHKKLHTFSFSKIGSSYVGCRDFV
ncbi:hypothetical protein C0995_008414 [Termitomyces sp. Mi166|nr:hypothetical protein C0995_008414 [Termitomyces sp. Mi166\